MIDKNIIDINYLEGLNIVIISLKNGNNLKVKCRGSGSYSSFFRYKNIAILKTEHDFSKEIYSLCPKKLETFPETIKIKDKIYCQKLYKDYCKEHKDDNHDLYKEITNKLPNYGYRTFSKANKIFQSLNISDNIKEEFDTIIETASKYQTKRLMFDACEHNLSIDKYNNLILRDIIIIEDLRK